MMTSLGMAAATSGRGEALKEEAGGAFRGAVDQAVRDRVIAGGACGVVQHGAGCGALCAVCDYRR